MAVAWSRRYNREKERRKNRARLSRDCCYQGNWKAWEKQRGECNCIMEYWQFDSLKLKLGAAFDISRESDKGKDKGEREREFKNWRATNGEFKKKKKLIIWRIILILKKKQALEGAIHRYLGAENDFPPALEFRYVYGNVAACTATNNAFQVGWMPCPTTKTGTVVETRAARPGKKRKFLARPLFSRGSNWNPCERGRREKRGGRVERGRRMERALLQSDDNIFWRGYACQLFVN